MLTFLPGQKYHEQLWRAGAELGLWLFIGVTCLAYGLKNTTANKAALILSLKSVNVSMLECFKAKQWPDRVNMVTCLLAMCGVYLVTTPATSEPIKGGSQSSDNGCVLVLIASFFYSFHIFRLGSLSKTFGNTPLSLAAVKALVMMVLTCVLIGNQWMFFPSISQQYTSFALSVSASIKLLVSQELSSTSSSSPDHSAALPSGTIITPALLLLGLCTLWNGAGSVGFSMWAQVFSQKHISSTAASFVYATTPLWAVFWSWLLLDGDQVEMSKVNWFGGGLLLAGVFAQLVHSSRAPALPAPKATV